jgi:hypothetical protein
VYLCDSVIYISIVTSGIRIQLNPGNLTTVPEFMMTTEEMLAEILAKLEEVDALLGICAGPPTPSSPPSIPTHIAGSGEDQERGVCNTLGVKRA